MNPEMGMHHPLPEGFSQTDEGDTMPPGRGYRKNKTVKRTARAPRAPKGRSTRMRQPSRTRRVRK